MEDGKLVRIADARSLQTGDNTGCVEVQSEIKVRLLSTTLEYGDNVLSSTALAYGNKPQEELIT